MTNAETMKEIIFDSCFQNHVAYVVCESDEEELRVRLLERYRCVFFTIRDLGLLEEWHEWELERMRKLPSVAGVRELFYTTYYRPSMGGVEAQEEITRLGIHEAYRIMFYRI